MSNGSRIPTPWKHRWRRFRYSALPALSFLLCMVLTFWLWREQGRVPNATGEIERKFVDVTAGTDGKLLPLDHPNGGWELFDPVQQNDVIARLDSELINAQLATLTTDLNRLQAQSDATEEEIRLEQAERKQDLEVNVARLLQGYHRCELEVLDRTVQIAADKVEAKRLEAQVNTLQTAGKGMTTPLEVEDTRWTLKRTEKQIEENGEALATAKTLRDDAKAAWSQWKTRPAVAGARTGVLLAPLTAEIETQNKRMEELEIQIAALEIRSPIAGMISVIYCRPGQHIRQGDPIVQIAADTGEHIVAYIRPQQGIRPEEGMLVEVKVRTPGGQRGSAEIVCVGPQYQPLPTHQLRDPRVPEWGLPVLISLPEFLRSPTGPKARPGEPVDITICYWAKQSG